MGRALFPNSAESSSTEGLLTRFPWKGLTSRDIQPIEDIHGKQKSAAIVDLLKWSLEPDPQSRPGTVDELLAHAFFDPVNGAMREHFIVDQIKAMLAEERGPGRKLGNVMISYCWDDAIFVLNKLAFELAPKVKGLWLDRLGGDQGMGEWTRASMQRGVAGADVVICVVSPAYIRSINCGYECALAAKMGKTIIPICLGVPFQEWPPKMIGETVMTTQFADGTDIKLFVDFADMEAFYIKCKQELEPRLMVTDPNRAAAAAAVPAAAVPAAPPPQKNPEMPFVGTRRTTLPLLPTGASSTSPGDPKKMLVQRQAPAPSSSPRKQLPPQPPSRSSPTRRLPTPSPPVKKSSRKRSVLPPAPTAIVAQPRNDKASTVPTRRVSTDANVKIGLTDIDADADVNDPSGSDTAAVGVGAPASERFKSGFKVRSRATTSQGTDRTTLTIGSLPGSVSVSEDSLNGGNFKAESFL